MKIYHNPRCSKSRQALQLIREAGIEPEVVEYLKSPPTVAELDAILNALGVAPVEITRTKDPLYKELGLSDKDLNRDEAIAVLAENPELIERPIVVAGDRAVVGRPPENVRELINSESAS